MNFSLIMKTLGKLSWFWIVVVLLLVSSSAQACSCVRSVDSLAEEFQDADLVILAHASPAANYPQTHNVLIEVLETWKGQSPEVFPHRYGSGPGMCEFPITPGHRYLLYMFHPATDDPEVFAYATVCGASRYMDTALPTTVRLQLDELATELENRKP